MLRVKPDKLAALTWSPPKLGLSGNDAGKSSRKNNPPRSREREKVVTQRETERFRLGTVKSWRVEFNHR